MADFKSRLKKMQSAAKEQMEDYSKKSFKAIPNDVYPFRVTVILDETRAKALMAKWCYVVAEGEFEGRKVFENTVLEDNKVGLQICRAHVEDLGYEWPEDSLADLTDIFDAITTAAPLVNCKTITKPDASGEYDNTKVYFREVLEFPDGSTQKTDEQIDAEADAAGEEQTTEEETTTDSDEVTIEQVIELFDALGIGGLDDTATIEETVDAIKAAGATWPRTDLDDEQFALLEKIDGLDLIEAEQPKKKAITVTKKTAPAAAPTKKGAPLPTKGKVGKR